MQVEQPPPCSGGLAKHLVRRRGHRSGVRGIDHKIPSAILFEVIVRVSEVQHHTLVIDVIDRLRELHEVHLVQRGSIWIVIDAPTICKHVLVDRPKRGLGKGESRLLVRLRGHVELDSRQRLHPRPP